MELSLRAQYRSSECWRGTNYTPTSLTRERVRVLRVGVRTRVRACTAYYRRILAGHGEGAANT